MSDPAQHLPTVFVVDDDKQFLDSLAGLLRNFGFHVRAFASPSGLLGCCHPAVPGCLVLNIRISRKCGLQFHEQLIRDGIKLPVIFIADGASVSTAVAAMKRGAIEFLEKPFQPESLVNCVRWAIEVDLRRRQQDAKVEAIADRVEQLSERERETLTLIQAGESNKSMAAKLYLSERAVEMRRASIMKKLEVTSLAELLNLTITHQFLTHESHVTIDHQLLDKKYI